MLKYYSNHRTHNDKRYQGCYQHQCSQTVLEKNILVPYIYIYIYIYRYIYYIYRYIDIFIYRYIYIQSWKQCAPRLSPQWLCGNQYIYICIYIYLCQVMQAWASWPISEFDKILPRYYNIQYIRYDNPANFSLISCTD